MLRNVSILGTATALAISLNGCKSNKCKTITGDIECADKSKCIDIAGDYQACIPENIANNIPKDFNFTQVLSNLKAGGNSTSDGLDAFDDKLKKQMETRFPDLSSRVTGLKEAFDGLEDIGTTTASDAHSDTHDAAAAAKKAAGDMSAMNATHVDHLKDKVKDAMGESAPAGPDGNLKPELPHKHHEKMMKRFPTLGADDEPYCAKCIGAYSGA